MDKVEKLWRSVQESGVPVLKLTFAEIEEILGFPIDHAFLSYKKNSLAYGYEVKKNIPEGKNSRLLSADIKRSGISGSEGDGSSDSVFF